MPHVELDTGINAFYRREGEGPPLVLIMGTGLDHRCWDGQVKEYRQVVRMHPIRQPGHGQD